MMYSKVLWAEYLDNCKIPMNRVVKGIIPIANSKRGKPDTVSKFKSCKESYPSPQIAIGLFNT